MPALRSGLPSVRVSRPIYGGLFHCEPEVPQPFVLPDELIRAPENPSLIPLILDSSAARVIPKCIHFGHCGGCHYQHADYRAQVELKKNILSGLLADAGLKLDSPIDLHFAEPWEYRNRIRLRLDRSQGPEQVYRFGYNRPDSHDFLPISMCPIAAPLLLRAATEVLELASRRIAQRLLAATLEVELFCNAEQTSVQIVWLLGSQPFGVGKDAEFAAICIQLHGALPELSGATAVLHPKLTRRQRRNWSGVEWGASGLTYFAAASRHWVRRGAFFQVNRFLTDRLVQLVCGGQSGTLAWDLFAGVGLFSRALAPSFTRILAVESNEVAAISLATPRRAAKGSSGIDAIHSTTLDFLRGRDVHRERPDLIVIDPPRAGLGHETSVLLTRIGAPQVVYVSCDPVTLVEDLAILTREVYQVSAVDLVDLFPQTYHLETVVHLILRESGLLEPDPLPFV